MSAKPKSILWLAWKDHAHPQAGGAEVVLREFMKRQVADGHRVSLLTARPAGTKEREMVDGIDVIRVGGNRYTHSMQALWRYVRTLRDRYDVVIETVNTAPYFSVLFKGRAKRLALTHQLAREIWFHETPRPLSYLGYYVLEPLALKLMSRSKVPLVTVSESTKKDISRYGWDPNRTHIISEGIQIKPLADLSSVQKFEKPTVLSLGAMRSMKRTLDQVEAFELAKRDLPDLQFKLAGDATSAYGARVLDRISASPYRNDIQYMGRINERDKVALMGRSHLITVTSVKEGWGLIVTEAASQGTPAVVYDVDGLRDSVKDRETGIITNTNPQKLAEGVVSLLQDQDAYEELRTQAWHWSKQITFDKGYQQFNAILERAA
ncbi:MAG TPA: glycosyltransferase family 4 protein [Candidatus Saccharimonadales bacterium]|nr:glycosyltransferase family 4 protein [Candidatus Saccharimonadales bacterium]